MIQTFSKFYYGHTIDEDNYWLDFQEGANPVVAAQINIGEYTLTDFTTQVASAMNLVGDFDYTVTVNRDTRIITVSSTGSFELLPVTGVNASKSVFGLLGFSADTGQATSHVATAASGSVWTPQYKAQDFVDFQDQQAAVDGVSRQTTSGKVESVRFGTTETMEAKFTFITDILQRTGCPIESDPIGVANARDFLEYATTKADLEFIPDRDDSSTFVKCLLESTDASSDGLGFKLQELYSRGLVGYYDTGLLKFRKIT